jgi:tetraacyldisaccharide 4'-kinase
VSFWWREEPPAWTLALLPLSLVYAAGARAHRAVARPAKARVPVISIGNLTVGGAGKTPVTMFLAHELARRGLRPAVLSRGYGRTSRAPLRVTGGTDPRACGDEPLLLSRRGLDVWVGADRARLAELAASAGARVLLLDDGLQHHALARDLDIVVVDAAAPFGNGSLLPRGPLRELPSSLARVQQGLLWLTRADQPRSPALRQLPAWPTVESSLHPVVENALHGSDKSALHGTVESALHGSDESDLRSLKVFLFAGIARPERFEATVRALGAIVTGTRWFRDHHWYSPAELASLRQAAGDAVLLTTEKDLVRLRDPSGIRALRVEVRITAGAAALDAALLSVLT